MKYAFLIALREYAENVKTKGFWIGILLFPVIIMAMLYVPRFLEEHATPTRYFVMLDQSGEAGKVVDDAVERSHQRRIYEACLTYLEKNKSPEVEKMAADLGGEQGAAMIGELGKDPAEIQKKIEALKEAGFRAFLASGGHEAFLAQVEMTGALKEDRDPFELPDRKFIRIPVDGQLDASADFESISAEIKEKMLVEGGGFQFDGKAQEVFAAILVPPAVFDDTEEKVEFWAKNLADNDLHRLVERALGAELRERGFAEAGVSEAEILRIQDLAVNVQTKDPTKKLGEEEADDSDIVRQWAPAGFVYLLWIALMSVVQMLLNNTVEEKSNRIVEVLLSSVTPGELMAGKLFGIAAVGVTMLLAWVGTLIAVLTWKAGPEMEIAKFLLEVIQESGLIYPFLGYFLGAYLLYAGIFLAIGSVCNTIKEAQNFMGPVMLIMMVPLLTMMFIPKEPNGTLATVLSWVPLYTPFVMMNRFASPDLPMFDLVGTSIVLAVSVVIMIWLTGKIFRTAILRTGQPPKLLEMLRWVKSKD